MDVVFGDDEYFFQVQEQLSPTLSMFKYMLTCRSDSPTALLPTAR